MASNAKQGKKKTRNEVKAYKAYVKYDTHDQRDTVALDNDNLRGSDQIDNNIYLPAEDPIVPWHYKLKKILKKHQFETIIVTLLCAFICWGTAAIIQIKVDTAVIQTRLDYLEKQVEALDTDNTAKEIIDLQIEAVKKDITNAMALEISDIESQLDLIEQQIEYIEKNSAGNTE